MMLHNSLASKMEEIDMHNVWYQQDGAKSQAASETMAISKRIISGRIFSKKASMTYTLGAPYFTVPDFWLTSKALIFN